MNIKELLCESLHDSKAQEITQEILNREGRLKLKGSKIYIGELFDLEHRDVYFQSFKTNNKDKGVGELNFGKFENSYKPFSLYVNRSLKGEARFSFLVHEVAHLLTFIKSGGATLEHRISSKIGKDTEKEKETYEEHTLKYLKKSDEMNSFYNQFYSILKGKRFNSIKELEEYVGDKINRNYQDTITYYLEKNENTKKYFLKRFYSDGIIINDKRENK